MRRQWSRAEAAWDEAVRIERSKGRFDRQGTDKRQFNNKKVEEAWAVAIALFEQACRQEKAWERAVSALQVFRPDGELNERSWAEAELACAAEELSGSVWAKVRRHRLSLPLRRPPLPGWPGERTQGSILDGTGRGKVLAM